MEPYHCTTCNWIGGFSDLIIMKEDNPRRVCPECGDYPFCVALIPKGLYCYHRLSHYADGRTIVDMCPYWKKRDDKEEQESGYCLYLGRGDWNVEYVSLLWDCVKECTINFGDESDIDFGEKKC